MNSFDYSSRRLVHWFKLRSLHLSYCHTVIPFVLISSYFKPQTQFPYTQIQSISYGVNQYVLFRSTHISNLGHGHMNIFRLSPPSNLHLYYFNVPVKSGYLLIDQIPKHYTSWTISTNISFPEDTMSQSHFHIFWNHVS